MSSKVQQMIEKYLNYLKTLNRSEETIATYKSRLKHFKKIIRKDYKDFLKKDINQYHDHLLNAKLKPSTVDAHLRTVKSYLSWLFESKMTLTDLSKHIRLQKRHYKPMVKPLSEMELTELMEMVKPDNPGKKLIRAILEMMYGCGLRRSEVCRLKLNSIDFERKTVKVNGKGNKEAYVPVSDVALFHVEKYLEVRNGEKRNEYLFVMDKSGKPVNANYISYIFKCLNRKFHKRVYPHLLRHCFACHMLKNGTGVKAIQQLLRHEDCNVTSKYLNLVKEEVKREYDEAMEGWL